MATKSISIKKECYSAGFKPHTYQAQTGRERNQWQQNVLWQLFSRDSNQLL